MSELIYGQFIEHILDCIDGGIYDPASAFADAEGLRTDVLEKLRQMAPPVMRFPGGTIMCQYHWEDAVGPLEQRVRRQNLIWGGELDPAFGTAEFIAFCRKIGAEPMICVNMASGTPEEAAHWVEYCNGTGNTHYANLRRSHGYPDPFGVRYWCIGNECYAEPDIGIQHDVDIYTRDAMEFIKWMKLTDKSIRTLAVGCDDDHWNRTVLNRLHAVSDYLSYHHYSSSADPFADERLLCQRLDQLKRLIDEYPETVDDFPKWYRFPPRQGKIQIALDEWNIWDYKDDATYGLHMTYTWRDALWTACVLNQLIMRPEIGMANLAQSVNVLAPIIARPDGSCFQTIAYPLMLYRRHMVGERVRFASGSDEVSISAVRRSDGTLCVAAVNRSAQESHEIKVPGQVQVIRLSGDSLNAVCDQHHSCVHEACESAADSVVLPPSTISLIQIKEQE